MKKECSLFIAQAPVKIQIVSRYFPLEHTSGSCAYLLDIMRYLTHAGCQLELLVLESLQKETTQHSAVQDIAKVIIMQDEHVERLETMQRRSLWRSKVRTWRLYRSFSMRLRSLITRLRFQRRGNAANPSVVWDQPPTEKEYQFVTTQAATYQPDVVMINYAFLADFLDIFATKNNALKTILIHDIFSQRVRDYRELGIASNLSAWNWEKESALLQKADVLLAIQEDDVRTLNKMTPSREVLCMPMSVTYCERTKEPIAGRCLFVGSPADHNIVGLAWFLKNTWPLILQALPSSYLHVCGNICDEFHEAFPHVIFRGRLDDLDEEYACAEVCIIPLIVGSGLKIKLVEALAHGCACVSTSVGIQGLSEAMKQAVLTADHPKDFAEAVMTLLKNPMQRQLLEEKAREQIEHAFSPETVYHPFVHRIYQHVAQFRPIAL